MGMEGEKVFEELSDIAERPYGMAWSMDGTMLFYSDGIKKTIFKCTINIQAILSDCGEMFNIADNIDQDAEPRGIAVDTSDHVWVAVANNGDKDLVDLKFAGEDLDFIYLLSEKHLYKLSGVGVMGRKVSDFVWIPDI